MAHYHPYHLVEPSPYPYMAAFGALGLTSASVMWFQSYAFGNYLATKNEIHNAIKVIRTLKIEKIVRKQANQHADKAMKSLDGYSGPAKKELISLLNFVVKRSL